MSGWQCQQASQSPAQWYASCVDQDESIFDIRILFILCFFHARCRFELLFSIQSAYLIQSITICHALIYCFGLVLIETFIVLPTKDTHTEKEGGRERLVTNYPNAEVKVELIDFWKSPLRLFGGSSGYRASFYGILMINGTLKPIKTFHSLKLSAKLNSTSKVLWIYTVLRWESNGWRTRKLFSGIRKFMSIYHFKMTS